MTAAERKNVLSLAILAALILLSTGCKPTGSTSDRPETAQAFPRPDRAVAASGDTQFSTEAARDEAGEATKLMDWAAISPGMTVADIGAGEGYYTVRLASRVGAKGRVLAQDINRGALERLGERIARDRLDNVAIKEGGIDDPRLPKGSFDRIFLVHMYHEVTEPYAFTWRMRDALKPRGQIIVVDRNRPTSQHGMPPKLLFCEFAAVGYRLMEFEERPEVGAYFARFERDSAAHTPAEINTCKETAARV
ncbi:MAG: hypothetical protein RIQ28_445 [Pseudomonadota bacterium]